MGKPQIRTTGFDDDSVTAGGYIERPEAFDPSTKGSTYHFRILCDPVIYYGTRVSSPDDTSGFFAHSVLDAGAIDEALQNNDWDTLKAGCPLFRLGLITPANVARAKRYATVVAHVATTSKGRTQKVNQILPWGFAGGKFVQLREILRNSIPDPVKGGKKHLRQVELVASLVPGKEKFKELNFQVAANPVASLKDVVAIVRENNMLRSRDPEADADIPDGDPWHPGLWQVLADYIAPEPAASLEASIARMMGGASEGDESDLVEDAPAPARRSGRPAKQPQPEPDDDADIAGGDITDDEAADLLGDVTDDVAGDDVADDNASDDDDLLGEPAPATTKPVAKPATKPVAKPATKPVAKPIVKPAARPIQGKPAAKSIATTKPTVRKSNEDDDALLD